MLNPNALMFIVLEEKGEKTNIDVFLFSFARRFELDRLRFLG
jgi:hypothetical protein